MSRYFTSNNQRNECNSNESLVYISWNNFYSKTLFLYSKGKSKWSFWPFFFLLNKICRHKQWLIELRHECPKLFGQLHRHTTSWSHDVFFISQTTHMGTFYNASSRHLGVNQLLPFLSACLGIIGALNGIIRKALAASSMCPLSVNFFFLHPTSLWFHLIFKNSIIYP